MPFFSNSAFGPPYKNILRLGTQTEPNYLFGNFDNKTQPWLFSVATVAITSNVATVTGTLRSGGGANTNVAPSVGAKMGIRGTQTNSGAFNVDPATVTGVTFTASTGAVSVTFALTHANVSSTNDVGDLVIQPYAVPDVGIAAGSASQSAALIFTPDESDNSRSLYAHATWSGTTPTAATVVLQVSNTDNDADFDTVANSQGCLSTGVVASSDALATIASSAVTQSGAQYQFIMGKFIRAKVLSQTGGDGTTGLVVSVFA